MKRFPPPLRYSIPGMLLVLSSVLGFFSFRRELALSYLRTEQSMSQQAGFSASQTASMLEYLLRKSDDQGADLVISQLGDEVNLLQAFLCDESNRITLTTQYEWQDRLVTELPETELLPAIHQVRQTQAGRVLLSADRQHVHAFYPVPLRRTTGEVRSSRIGVLVLEYDLSLGKAQEYADALQRSLEGFVAMLWLCVAVWLLFEQTLTRRATRLVAASHSLAMGDLEVRTQLSGSDELAQISVAFDQMAEKIQFNTEALQTSQAHLANAHGEVMAKAHQLGQALQELQQTQAQLIQAEKMSSLGQLVAGVAHEINNPVNFIYGNLNYANIYTQDLLNLVQMYRQHYPHPAPVVQAAIAEVDLDYLIEDLPKLLNSMRVGAERIRQIVLTLRNFSRLDEAEMKQVDIHEGIDSTLLILQNRLKAQPDHAEIRIIKEYGQLPQVECYPGQLNQVFMNILSNAIDALEAHLMAADSPGSAVDEPPSIWIRTEAIANLVVIRIADNGPGMTEDVKAQLFNPFFTTKPVGKGTGLGLSISYQIINEQHQGVLTCSSGPGKGTVFWIEIPVSQQDGA